MTTENPFATMTRDALVELRSTVLARLADERAGLRYAVNDLDASLRRDSIEYERATLAQVDEAIAAKPEVDDADRLVEGKAFDGGPSYRERNAPEFWGDPSCASCRTHAGGCSEHNGPEYRPMAPRPVKPRVGSTVVVLRALSTPGAFVPAGAVARVIPSTRADLPAGYFAIEATVVGRTTRWSVNADDVVKAAHPVRWYEGVHGSHRCDDCERVEAALIAAGRSQEVAR